MYRIIILIVLFLSVSINSIAGELQLRAYQEAQKDIGIQEVSNSNDHPRINQYLQLAGVPLGSPYCAAACYFWFNQASTSLNIKNPLYRTAATNQIYHKALANPVRFRFIKTRSIILGSEKPALGDLILWKTQAIPEADRWKGHTGFFITLTNENNKFHSAEANTVLTNNDTEQREQTSKSKNRGGVYYKIREFKTGGKFNLLGLVRVRGDYGKQ